MRIAREGPGHAQANPLAGARHRRSLVGKHTESVDIFVVAGTRSRPNSGRVVHYRRRQRPPRHTMKRRSLFIVAIGLIVAAAVGFAILDPDAHLQGWVGGEPFFQGRSASAWRRNLIQTDDVRSTAAREALTSGKGDAVPVCVWVMEHAAEPEARGRAADAIRQMGKDGKSGGEALLKATRRSRPNRPRRRLPGRGSPGPRPSRGCFAETDRS